MENKTTENIPTKEKNALLNNLFQLATTLGIVILLIVFTAKLSWRFDLTKDKRFTLSETSENVLSNLNDVFYIQVYLDGDLPHNYLLLKKSVQDMLEEFRAVGKRKIEYEFINPHENDDPKVMQEVYRDLQRKRLKPKTTMIKEEGGVAEKLVFPCALINYQGKEVPVNFYYEHHLGDQNENINQEEANINYSAQMLEYEFIKAINTLNDTVVEKIAFIDGHGELAKENLASISRELSFYYQIDRGVMDGQIGILDDYKALIIAKPTTAFSEEDKYVLDQYIMQGGRVLWLIDAVPLTMDSLRNGEALAYYNDLNLTDMLFKYGVRVNPNLIKDLECDFIQMNVALDGQKPKWTVVPWIYNPLLGRGSQLESHILNKSYSLIKSEFASAIDTVGNPKDVTRTVLLTSSARSKLVSVNSPFAIKLEEYKDKPDMASFREPFLPVSILLEGEFESSFKGRNIQHLFPKQELNTITKSKNTKMVVISDGDIIRNDIRITQNGMMVLPVGFNKYISREFGNKNFLLNIVNYLTDSPDWINLRARNFELRMLNKGKIKAEKLKWQLINVIAPIVVIILAGIAFYFYRKKEYQNFALEEKK